MNATALKSVELKDDVTSSESVLDVAGKLGGGKKSRGVLMLFVAMFVLLTLFALSHSFTSFASYDDESYVMMTMQTFFQGQRLYGETYSQYGPAFYLVQTPIHEWFQVPISHDVVRIKTIICWLLIALVSAKLVAEVTKNRTLGLLALLLITLHLEKLGLEPAHPQELIAVFSVIALWMFNGQRWWFWMLAGVCAALVGLTKLNAGAILALPLMFAAAWPLANRVSRGRFSVGKILFALLGFACLLLPAFIAWTLFKSMLTGLSDSTGSPITAIELVWPTLILLSAGSVIWLAWKRIDRSDSALIDVAGEPARKNWVGFASVIFGGLAMSIVTVFWILSRQTSFEELVWGVVKQHTFMPQEFLVTVSPNAWEMLTVIVFAIIFGQYIWQSKNSKANSLVLFAVPLALFVSVVLSVQGCWLPILHGYEPRGASRIFSFIGPLLMPFLVVRTVTAPRLAIAMHACLGPLLGFPVSGTQLSLGTVAIIVGLLIATNDVLEVAAERKSNSPARQASLKAVTDLAAKSGLILVLIGLVISTTVFGYRWTNYVSLDQPGCRWVRLDSDTAEHEREAASAMRDVAGDHIAFDIQNNNRFFFWTGKQPLTAISPTFWPRMLTPEQQAKLRDALAEADEMCVVKLRGENDLLKTWAPEVEQQMFRDWQMMQQVGEWHIGYRPRTSN